MSRRKVTPDELVEAEISRLLESPDVQLAKKELALINRRKQYMYKLRSLEKHGKKLRDEGWTEDALELKYRTEDDT
nr:MAG TPA: hypothetical protein [Caudoviricetes sp.]